MKSSHYLIAGTLVVSAALIFANGYAQDLNVDSVSQDQSNAMSSTSEEIVFLEIHQSARRAPTFLAKQQELVHRLSSLGVRGIEHWLGPDRYYMKALLPASTVKGQSVLIDGLRAEPLVSKVIAGAAANLELRDLEFLHKLDASVLIPEWELRGFSPKRSDFKPDLTLPHTNEILVKYLESESFSSSQLVNARAQISAIGASFGGYVSRSLDAAEFPIDVVTLSQGADYAKAIGAFLASSFVEFAQPNYIYYAQNNPNDPYFTNGILWGMNKISAPLAWNTRTDASSVVVAVLDTGLDYNHQDLAGNMWKNPSIGAGNYNDGTYGWNVVSNNGDPMDDFAPIYHGTHVSGTIGAVGNNNVGVVGVAWSVKLMAVKILNSSGSGTTTQFRDGINYARFKGAKVISASVGNYPTDAAVGTAITQFGATGGVFVDAAANNNSNNDQFSNWPANFGRPNQIVIGASDPSDAKASFSNYGRWSVDVFAPGTNTWSTMRGNGYQYLSGTSMATPHVSGLVALAKAQFPWETPNELVDRIRTTVDSASGLVTYCMSGGRINAAAALGTRPAIVESAGRCQVNTGVGIAIGGIWIIGPNPKRVAFRGLGPSVPLSGTLADPQITIYNSSGQIIGSNDNWGSLSQADKNELAAHGVTPTQSLESAWIGTLAPGGYTVHLSGVGGGTGIGMIESRDFDLSTANRFFNLSTRCYVDTGSKVAIQGFIITGTVPRQVYLRALGPTLTSFGVSGALQDTVITLYDSTGAQIASNDDWRDYDGSSTALETRLEQLGLPPFDDRESAIVMRLNPGAYTVHLTGKNNTTGIGLIEINEY